MEPVTSFRSFGDLELRRWAADPDIVAISASRARTRCDGAGPRSGELPAPRHSSAARISVGQTEPSGMGSSQLTACSGTAGSLARSSESVTSS